MAYTGEPIEIVVARIEERLIGLSQSVNDKFAALAHSDEVYRTGVSDLINEHEDRLNRTEKGYFAMKVLSAAGGIAAGVIESIRHFWR